MCYIDDLFFSMNAKVNISWRWHLNLLLWHHKNLSCWNMIYRVINSMLTLRDIYLYNVDIALGWPYIMHLYDSSSGLSTTITWNRGVSSGFRATQCRGTLDVLRPLHRQATSDTLIDYDAEISIMLTQLTLLTPKTQAGKDHRFVILKINHEEIFHMELL